jgi:hypothetical protein
MHADYNDVVVNATVHAGVTEGILEVRWMEGERQCRPVDKYRNSELMLSLSRPLIHSAVRLAGPGGRPNAGKTP